VVKASRSKVKRQGRLNILNPRLQGALLRLVCDTAAVPRKWGGRQVAATANLRWHFKWARATFSFTNWVS